jgi:hypothetical protein
VALGRAGADPATQPPQPSRADIPNLRLAAEALAVGKFRCDSVYVSETDSARLRWEILVSASDSGAQMLVHVWMEAWNSDLPLSATLAMAEDAVLDLLSRGYIQLCKMRGSVQNPEWEPVAVEETGALLKRYVSWVPPSADHLWLLITDAGEAALNASKDQELP